MGRPGNHKETVYERASVFNPASGISRFTREGLVYRFRESEPDSFNFHPAVDFPACLIPRSSGKIM